MDVRNPPDFNYESVTETDNSSRSVNEAGGAPEGAPPASAATQKLWEDVQSLIAQAKPLCMSFVAYAKARAELQLFITTENARLAAARLFVWSCAVLMSLFCWVFFCFFLWRVSIEVTGIQSMGPLALTLMHGLAAFGLWTWQKGMKL